MYFGRGPNKIQEPYTFKHMYADYIDGINETSPYYVTYTEYVDICSMYFKLISRALIDDGIRFKLPSKMGEVFILKSKVNINNVSKLPIDWQLTVQYGKKIFNLNEHTHGFKYCFFWSKPQNFKNKFIYRLVFTRDNKRSLAKAIKQYHKDYFEK